MHRATIEKTSKGLKDFTTMNMEDLSSKRGSDAVIFAARFVNAVLTFAFGFEFLYEIFNFFGLDASSPDLTIFRVLGGAFLVIITDLAFVAWRNLEYRENATEEQMTTAGTASKMSLAGSLAASVGTVVLMQNMVEFDPMIDFVVGIVALAVAALLTIGHVYWHSQYTAESESAVMADEQAKTRAAEMKLEKKKREDAQTLELKRQEEQHNLEMELLQAELEAQTAEARAKSETQLEMIYARVSHSKDVAKQTKEQLARRVSGTAGRIAKAESDQLMREFLAAAGHDVNDFNDPN